MSSNLREILRLEVPVIVRIAERDMSVSEVLNLIPGSIIELPKRADGELELMINNKAIGSGVAVKVAENFGVRITSVGDETYRVSAMAATKAGAEKDPIDARAVVNETLAARGVAA